jgi:rhamnulokinase
MKPVFKKNYIITDFGASNGRVSIGRYGNNSFEIENIHRFDNEQVGLNGRYYWDVLELYSELKKGIHYACKQYTDIRSLAIDAWGLDFAFIDSNGRLISNPLSYRDPSKKNDNFRDFFRELSEEEFFKRTGYFATPLAAVFYLNKLVKENDYQLYSAEHILPISDLFNYFLCANTAVEYTTACNMFMVNCSTKKWDERIISQSGFPVKILPGIVDSGISLGNISTDVANELSIKPFSVVTAAGHDTAAAVAALPYHADSFENAFLSTGTWLVLGAETEEPVLDFSAASYAFTNEGGAFGRNFFAKDITGFWIIQKCLDKWEKEEGRKISWKEIDEAVKTAEPFRSIINTQDKVFLDNTENMPGLIVNYCSSRNIEIPSSIAQMSRCIYESMALAVRYYFELLEKYCGKAFKKLCIAGGGVNNSSFCQWLSNSLNIEVQAGPVEASTAGNLIAQLIADKEVADLSEGRQVCKNSFSIQAYYPRDREIWDEKYVSFLALLKKPQVCLDI